MPIRPGGLAAIAVVMLGLGVVTLGATAAGAAPPPPCKNAAECKQECDKGITLSCRELGRLRTTGDHAEPDRGEAATAYQRACDATPRDSMSCLELSILQQDGWTLELARSPEAAAARLDQAIAAGTSGCAVDDGLACVVAARAHLTWLDRHSMPKEETQRATDILAFAKKGCELGVVAGCAIVKRDLWRLTYPKLLDEKALSTAREAIGKKGAALCKAGDFDACVVFENDLDTLGKKGIEALVDKACDDGHATACVFKAIMLADTITKPEPDDPVVKQVIDLILDACIRSDFRECLELAESVMEPNGEFAKLAGVQTARGMKIFRGQCERGDFRACLAAGRILLTGEHKVAKDVDGSRVLLDRACRLQKPTDAQGQPFDCEACLLDTSLPECRRRDTWKLSVGCVDGDMGACEEVGDRYRAGDGVAASTQRAAESYKLPCGAAFKGACAKLDEVCRGDLTLGEQLCAPSLLHTDVFYEAEWQFRVNQTATLRKGEGAAAGEPTVSVDDARASGGAGLSMRRGALDADLVVSVVIDRARQAAIKLVVEELLDKKGARGLRTYMRDLLDQGAKLLADTTSLRRDQLQDLGMTLVRAFAASNLVRTVAGDLEALKRAPVIGVIVAGWKPAQLEKHGRVLPEVEAYLADMAYWALGAEALFARSGAADDPAPDCPFEAARKPLCDALSDRAAVTRALRIDGVLTALNMVRALQDEGGIDVRRLIEAIAQSRSIVDFASTPGLDLDYWQGRIIGDLRARVRIVRDRMSGIQRLLDATTYSDAGPDLGTLTSLSAQVREFLRSDEGQALIGADVEVDLAALLGFDQVKAAIGTPPEQLLASLRTAGLDALRKVPWQTIDALWRKLEESRVKLETFAGQIETLARHVTTIRLAVSHHQRPGPDAAVKLAIDDMPLGDLDELIAVFPDVIEVLDGLDHSAREIFPGIDLRGLRFARSSVVRLVGFLDLMSRVARSVRLTQTVRDVVDTLQLLGRWRDNEFSAPLYDMLQPVLAMIETRKPMPLEQLFAIVGRVRLDSLVTSLFTDRPCANEERAECWVFKIAYSLQEAITRDGDAIRIDGAEVAKRLAQFGDDYKKRQKGGMYFHLTVGVGTLFSAPPDAMAGDGGTRMTPVIAEQVGFGWASPAFWKDRLTFKVGLAASGILYRMLLDNAESDAVMGHAFVAIDVYDLVEAYIAGTVLAYPPADGDKATIEPGVTFGLSVPLSAYLEKL